MSSANPADGQPRTGWARLLAEPARPARVAARPDAHWLVVGTVCVGAFMGQLDASIVTLALPTLRTEFHTSVGIVEWVALAYLLVLVSAVVAIGRLADMVGRKLLYTYGFGVFIVGSALCGAAPSLTILVLARALQAVGAAMLQANSVALIVQAMPEGKLGRGIGVQGAAQAVGLAVGPAVGGALISLGGWRLIFLINVPVGLLGLILGWFLLPRSRHLQERQSFDRLGGVLLLPAIASVLAGMSFGERTGWSSPIIITALCGGAGLGLLFVAHERRAAAPMIDLRLFRRAAFTAGIVSGLLSYLVMFGVLFVVPFYLETKRDLSAAAAGLQLTVLPVALAVAAPAAGRLADRAGARTVTVSGMAFTALGLVLLAAERHPDPVMLVDLAIIGAGLGAFTPANNAAIMGSAPRTHTGVAGGVLNMTRGLGTSLGVAITGLAFALAAGAGSPGGPGLTSAETHGFVVAVGVLAGCAIVAACVSAIRGSVGLVRDHDEDLAF